MKVYDLFCDLGGWAEGFLAGWESAAIGMDYQERAREEKLWN